MKKKIIFLFPTLNEEKAIAKTIQKVPVKKLTKKGYFCDIVIVDGQSTDKTIEISRKNKAKVIISPKRGYGFQYKYALSKLKGDIVITGDADGTYPVEEADKILKIFNENNLDFLTTNRFANLYKGAMSLSHNIGNRILTFIGNILFNLRLKDNQSGMWCFNLDKVKKLGLEDEDMAFSQEIKIRAFKKLKCKEVGISYKPRIGKSKLNYKHAIKNMFGLFTLRFKI